MRSRSILAALAVVFAPIPVLAQFATVVAPPRRPRPPVVAAAADTTGRPVSATAAAAAEEQRRQMLDIKAWVDSAAGALAGRPNSAATPAMPGAPATPSPTPDTTAGGRRAPTVRPDSTRRRPAATRPTAELPTPPARGAVARPARSLRHEPLV